ncbi:MAG: AbrB/MazE/SpoVT family DNA-binding domain-containing protein [bacterium]
MTVTTVSTKGQIVIPAWIRKSLGLRPKSKLLVKLSDDKQRVLVEPLPEDPIESACGFLSGGVSLTQALLEERREEYRLESEKFT